MKRRVVVITGGSAGAGRAAARLFAAGGAAVGLIARGRDGLVAARREVEAAGGRACAVQADVSDFAQLEAAAKTIESVLGSIDVWVNNAGISVFSPVAELDPSEARRVMEVNYLGAVHGTLIALSRMKPRNEGVIIQVGSALANRGLPLQAAYCASKHALQGFTESLRCELLHDKSQVRVTMLEFPSLNTPFYGWAKSRLRRQPKPFSPVYQPEVAARAIVWAADHPRREINVGALTALSVVGNNLAPGLLDRYLSRVAYGKQQSREAAAARPDNLWKPVPGDHGAHGVHGSGAASWSAQLWMTEHRWAVLPAAAACWLLARLAPWRR